MSPNTTYYFAPTGLSPNTTYYFDVAAYNAAGTTWANFQSATTLQINSVSVPSLEATADVAAGPFTTGAPTDLLTVNPGSNTLGLLAGLGGGRFANPVAIPTAEPAQVVCVADFNHTGSRTSPCWARTR